MASDLLHIVNKSLHSGVFPQALKTAVIKPLLCCVHTGRDAMFGGGAITCTVNAETRTDANSLRRRA